MLKIVSSISASCREEPGMAASIPYVACCPINMIRTKPIALNCGVLQTAFLALEILSPGVLIPIRLQERAMLLAPLAPQSVTIPQAPIIAIAGAALNRNLPADHAMYAATMTHIPRTSFVWLFFTIPSHSAIIPMTIASTNTIGPKDANS